MQPRKLVIAGSIVAAASLSYVVQAQAGYKEANQVLVNKTTRTFSGSMGSAHNSSDSVQFILCRSNATTTAGLSGYCYAKNSAGVSAFCNTTDASLISVIQSVEAETYIEVSYDASSKCTSVAAIQASATPPKSH